MAGGDGDKASPNFNLQISDKKDSLSYGLGITGSRTLFARPGPTMESRVANNGALTMLRDRPFYDEGHNERLSVTPRLVWRLDNGDTLTSQNLLERRAANTTSLDRTFSLIGPSTAYPYLTGDATSRENFVRSNWNWGRKLANGASLDVKFDTSQSSQKQSKAQLGFARQHGPALGRP